MANTRKMNINIDKDFYERMIEAIGRYYDVLHEPRFKNLTAFIQSLFDEKWNTKHWLQEPETLFSSSWKDTCQIITCNKNKIDHLKHLNLEEEIINIIFPETKNVFFDFSKLEFLSANHFYSLHSLLNKLRTQIKISIYLNSNIPWKQYFDNWLTNDKVESCINYKLPFLEELLTIERRCKNCNAKIRSIMGLSIDFVEKMIGLCNTCLKFDPQNYQKTKYKKTYVLSGVTYPCISVKSETYGGCYSQEIFDYCEFRLKLVNEAFLNLPAKDSQLLNEILPSIAELSKYCDKIANLNLPGINIPRHIDIDISGEVQIYFVSPLPEGISLKELMEKTKLTLENKKNIFYSLVESVSYLHKLKILHRYLLLENIRVTYEGNVILSNFQFMKVKSLAFDLLKWVQTSSRSYHSGLAPETDGEEYTYASDIWSLGILGLQIFTNDPYAPYGKDLKKIREEIEKFDAESYLKQQKKFPFEISECLSRCLKKDSKDRFSNATKLLDFIKG